MNTNETKGYNWIREQGYTNIVFHPRSTPDFTTDERAFEVKTLDSNAISFTPNQFKQLSKYPNAHILVYNNEPLPIANIPFSDISDGKPKWNNINIRQTPPRLKPMKHITVTLSTFNRFLSFRQYGERHEALLVKIMDMVDKYLASHRNKSKFS